MFNKISGIHNKPWFIKKTSDDYFRILTLHDQGLPRYIYFKLSHLIYWLKKLIELRRFYENTIACL